MANDTSKTKRPSTGTQNKRKQQGGHGGGSQQQQENPDREPMQPGREPEINEDMNNGQSDSDSTQRRHNTDIERS